MNVPKYALKLRAGYEVISLPGLALGAALVHEGPQQALPGNSIELSGWTRIDLGARWTTTSAARSLVWRIGIDNAFDHRAWRESPHQFSHAYLFPLAPRTWRASLQASL